MMTPCLPFKMEACSMHCYHLMLKVPITTFYITKLLQSEHNMRIANKQKCHGNSLYIGCLCSWKMDIAEYNLIIQTICSFIRTNRKFSRHSSSQRQWWSVPFPLRLLQKDNPEYPNFACMGSSMFKQDRNSLIVSIESIAETYWNTLYLPKLLE